MVVVSIPRYVVVLLSSALFCNTVSGVAIRTAETSRFDLLQNHKDYTSNTPVSAVQAAVFGAIVELV